MTVHMNCEPSLYFPTHKYESRVKPVFSPLNASEMHTHVRYARKEADIFYCLQPDIATRTHTTVSFPRLYSFS